MTEGRKEPIRKNGEHAIFHYTVDDEPQQTSEHSLTPQQILTMAGLSPSIYYLVQIIGHEQKSYKDTPEHQINMHQHMKFVSVYTGETPVSGG